VATVTVTPSAASLVAQQTQTLTADTRDASGNALTGRSVAWSTTAGTVATVSQAGLVTAVGPGSATITATSEGKSGSATITVADGGQLPVTGGTVTGAGGAVSITVPAGALAAPIAVTVAPATRPTAELVGGAYGVVGTTYDFGPAGTTFTSPVTVTVKYDPAKLPAWALPTDLGLYHFTAGAWVRLPNQVIDPVARTVTATTMSFSPFTIGTRLPQGTLTPAVGSVNFIQRSVTFTASVPGRTGTGFTYTWTGTGFNGAVSPLFGADAQYTMTQPQLPQGELDQIQVIIRGPIDPSQPNVIVPLAQAEAIINADLTLSFEVLPDFKDVLFGSTQQVVARARNPDGSIYQPPAGLSLLKVWKSSQLHGDLDIHNPNHKTDADVGIYTAKTAQQSNKLPPRVDGITVDFYVGYYKTYRTPVPTLAGISNRLDSIRPRHDVLSGTKQGFLDVEPNTLLANFTVRNATTNCVTADAILPKKAGATSYALKVTGIIGSPLGTEINRVITGTTSTGSIMDVYDGGSFFGVPLDGGCNSIPEFLQDRIAMYHSQYGNAVFAVTTTP